MLIAHPFDNGLITNPKLLKYYTQFFLFTLNGDIWI